MSAYTSGPPQTAARPRRTTRSSRVLITIGVILVAAICLAVIGDRVAAAYVEGRVAGQMQNQGFTSKPKVSINGFPFLTQLTGRDFHNVTITATNLAEGPVRVSRLDATLHEVRINSAFSGGTVDQLDGTALLTFADLASAAGTPGLTLSAAGSDQVRVGVDLGVITGTATAQVTKVSRNEINIRVISAEGIPSSALGSLGDLNVPIPNLPMGLAIQSVSVAAQGVLVRVTGQNTTFGH